MPIPEPRIRRSGLTKQQKQDHMRTIYGVTMPQELSFEEVARMRQIVAQFDADRKPMSTVDLNNPPREQYRFQKFPMMVYDLTRSTPAKVFHKTADSEEELQDLIEAGWSVQAPEFTEEREEPLSPQYQTEATRVDEQIETLKQKRAYNRKAA